MNTPLRIVGLIVLLLIGIGVFGYARYRYLLGKTGGLIAISDTFPRTYSVGTGSQRIRYLAIGDSTVQGVGAATLSESYPYQVAGGVSEQGTTVEVTNVGVSGARIADVLRDQMNQVRAGHFDLITISVGANDALHSTEQGAFTRDLTELRKDLEQYQPGAKVYMSTLPKMGLAPAFPWPYTVYLDRRVQEKDRALSQVFSGSTVRFVDWYKDGQLDLKINKNYYAIDRFHPAVQGYTLWARLFIQKILIR
jgi:acyl-CoA thioesterase-1